MENPELYAVFPFRLAALETPDADLARRALAHRWDRGHTGWRQDDIFMAYLGLADAARSNLVARARIRLAKERNQFIRAGTADDPVWLKPMRLGNRPAQCRSTAVWI